MAKHSGNGRGRVSNPYIRRGRVQSHVSCLLVTCLVRSEFSSIIHSILADAHRIVGLVIGASFWGFGCDIVGRRFTFNCSFFFCGIFLIAAGGGNSFVAVAALLAASATGCGGNLVVDSAIFLEFTPASHQWLLFVLATWWDFGEIIPSAMAWGYLSHFSCPAGTPAGQCKRADNMGWRYVCFTMGALIMVLWAIR